ncbi:MAG: hypothetical protein FJX46_11685 [Alphaproteobacteria bacterium]|nr:hypothetical protein [Alphaproteobacteria bacterium]
MPMRDPRAHRPGLSRLRDDPGSFLPVPTSAAFRPSQNLGAHLVDILQHVLKDVLSRPTRLIDEGSKTTLMEFRLGREESAIRTSANLNFLIVSGSFVRIVKTL